MQPPRPDLVAKAIKPDYALGPHTASLGLALSTNARLPERFRTGMFIGQHGSWNREPRSGYKVIFVPFADGKPSGMPIDVLTGFVDGEGEAKGRPVGVAVDKQGGLLVADDVGNVIWRVTAQDARSNDDTAERTVPDSRLRRLYSRPGRDHEKSIQDPGLVAARDRRACHRRLRHRLGHREIPLRASYGSPMRPTFRFRSRSATTELAQIRAERIAGGASPDDPLAGVDLAGARAGRAPSSAAST